MTNPGAASTSTSTFVGGGTPVAVGNSSADKVGFYGATFVTQPVSANQAAVVSTGAVTAAQYGFATAGQANGIITLLNQIRSDLVTLGLLKGSS